MVQRISAQLVAQHGAARYYRQRAGRQYLAAKRAAHDAYALAVAGVASQDLLDISLGELEPDRLYEPVREHVVVDEITNVDMVRENHVLSLDGDDLIDLQSDQPAIELPDEVEPDVDRLLSPHAQAVGLRYARVESQWGYDQRVLRGAEHTDEFGVPNADPRDREVSWEPRVERKRSTHRRPPAVQIEKTIALDTARDLPPLEREQRLFEDELLHSAASYGEAIVAAGALADGVLPGWLVEDEQVATLVEDRQVAHLVVDVQVSHCDPVAVRDRLAVLRGRKTYARTLGQEAELERGVAAPGAIVPSPPVKAGPRHIPAHARKPAYLYRMQAKPLARG